MRKQIDFGFIEFNKGEKNSVCVEIEMKPWRHGSIIFSASAYVWEDWDSFERLLERFCKVGKSPREYDIIAGGQCLDKIAPHIKGWKFKAIYYLWKKYHLRELPFFWVWVMNKLILKTK